MVYQVIVKGFDSGLNELLAGRIYNPRTRKYHNVVKNKNDALCQKFINEYMKGVHIDKPVKIDYVFFVPNKRHDRMNTASAFIKSFEDALQKCKVIDNDGFDCVLTPMLDFYVDKENPRIEVTIREAE